MTRPAFMGECGHEVIAGTGTLAEPVVVKACTLSANHAGEHHDRDLVDVVGVDASWECPPDCDGQWGHAHRLDGAS